RLTFMDVLPSGRRRRCASALDSRAWRRCTAIRRSSYPRHLPGGSKRGFGQGLSPAADLEPLVDVLQMLADGPLGNDQYAGDLAVRAPGMNQSQNLPLACGELRRVVASPLLRLVQRDQVSH